MDCGLPISTRKQTINSVTYIWLSARNSHQSQILSRFTAIRLDSSFHPLESRYHEHRASFTLETCGLMVPFKVIDYNNKISGSNPATYPSQHHRSLDSTAIFYGYFTRPTLLCVWRYAMHAYD